MEHSKDNLTYLDTTSGQKITPYVIEPSVGVERLFYAIVVDKYEVETIGDNDTREVLHLPYILAPYKAAILPLSAKLNEQAKTIYETLVSEGIESVYDTSGSIGKRYRRQDAIGTPYCITFDFDSLNDQSVTIRERDSMKQKRIPINKIKDFFKNHVY
jgi:glycyl-tRNA synthetase